MEATPWADANASSNDDGDRQWPEAVSGDKAYSSGPIRDWCHEREIADVIPTRSDESRREDFDKARYKRRNIVERAIGWLKECRAVMTRFEKYAIHFLGMVTLAIIQRYLTVHL